MQTEALIRLINDIQRKKTETQNIELKAAEHGCPTKLFDTLSSFSNQDDGGIIIFGIDEKDDYKVIEHVSDKIGNNGAHYWKIQCKYCGDIKEKSIDKIKQEKLFCSCQMKKYQSVYERIIGEYLTQKNIVFIQEKTFKELKNPETNKLLRIDFFLPDYNCAIEVDGKQHFQESTGIFKENYSLKDIQYLDNLKNEYCKSHGINLINTKPRHSIKALFDIVGKSNEKLSSNDISFFVTPRLNSAGRLNNPNLAVKLLVSQNYADSYNYSLELENYNSKRKELTEETYQFALNQACKILENNPNKICLVLYGKN